MVEKVTCAEKKVIEGNGKKVALMDFGAKDNIAKSLNERGCQVTIYPAGTKAEEIISSGRVFVNFENIIKHSKVLKEGDIITIRGKGRFKILELEGNTKKGREIVIIEKFV